MGGVGTEFYATNVFISHAVNGIHFWHARPARTEVDRLTVATNEVGVRIDGGYASIRRLHAFNNSTGYFDFTAWGSYLRDSLVHDNTHDGVVLGGSESRPFITFSTMARNGGAGLRVFREYYDGAEPKVENCLVASNQFGIVTHGIYSNQFPIRYCNVFGNAISNYVNSTAASNCLSVEPRLRSDLSLKRGSPCIDAGYPTFQPFEFDFAGNPRGVDDPATPNTGETYDGGPVNDIGAFEFQPLRITSMQRAGVEVIIRFQTQLDEEYELQGSESFAAWTTVLGGLHGTGREISVPVPATNSFRFYRLAVMP